MEDADDHHEAVEAVPPQSRALFRHSNRPVVASSKLSLVEVAAEVREASEAYVHHLCACPALAWALSYLVYACQDACHAWGLPWHVQELNGYAWDGQALACRAGIHVGQAKAHRDTFQDNAAAA